MKTFITVVLVSLIPYIAIAQNVQNISLLAKVEYERALNDVWGYTDGNGREYALVGLDNGTSIVDLNTPSSPKEISRIPGGNSIWKDIKTYKNRAFVVGEYREGLQIIDLSDLPNQLDTTDYIFWKVNTPVGFIGACHNIYIEEATGIAYLSGCAGNVTGGVIMLDIKPELPVYLGKTNNGYSHDVYVRNDTLYSSDFFDGVFSIIDVRNKSNPILLANHQTPSSGTHNAWLSDNGNTLFTTDEINNAPVAAYDISNFSNIKLIDIFYPTGSIGTGLLPHNVHVKNDFLITSYYAEGVVITDASRPDNLIQVGQFDTYTGPNNALFGAWGAFPFFESDILLVSDIENGLFVLKPNYIRAAFFEGIIRDSITKSPVGRVSIEGFRRGASAFQIFTKRDGTYSKGLVQGGIFDIIVSKPGYKSQQFSINLVNGQDSLFEINLFPTSLSIVQNNKIGCVPHEVTFFTVGQQTDNYQWFFEGGTPTFSNSANPTVIYEEAGSFKVTLESIIDGDTLNLIQNNSVEVFELPTSQFEIQQIKTTFNFSNLSINADSILWEFPDGTTSTEENPTRIFENHQLGATKLTAFNQCGQDTYSLNLDGTTSLNLSESEFNFEVFPNLTNFNTTIQYHLNAKQMITLALYNSNGQLVRFLEHRKIQTPAKYEYQLDRMNFEAGVYILVLGAGKNVVYRKIIFQD